MRVTLMPINCNDGDLRCLAGAFLPPAKLEAAAGGGDAGRVPTSGCQLHRSRPYALLPPATETRIVTRATFVFIFESCQLLQTRVKVSFVLPCHLQPTLSPSVLRDAAGK